MKIGIVLFPQFEPLDLYGPFEAITCLTHLNIAPELELYMIAEAAGPVSTAGSKTGQYSFGCETVATHSFRDALHLNLDVVLVPGGLGAIISAEIVAEGLPSQRGLEIKFIKDIFPSLKYFLTVCNGSGLAAAAGVLDGLQATSNKSIWSRVTKLGPQTHWIADARWVESGSGKVWTAAGVSAGIDMTVAWIQHVWGSEAATSVCDNMEYVRNTEARGDRFAVMHQCSDVSPQSF